MDLVGTRPFASVYWKRMSRAASIAERICCANDRFDPRKLAARVDGIVWLTGDKEGVDGRGAAPVRGGRCAVACAGREISDDCDQGDGAEKAHGVRQPFAGTSDKESTAGPGSHQPVVSRTAFAVAICSTEPLRTPRPSRLSSPVY